MVNGLSTRLAGRRVGRRSFLAGAAVVGSAVATHPWQYATRPLTAYASVCGSGAACDEGWSAFCCTITGANQCPPGSFVAGWWKADRSGFCCGSARYYIDCNASCGSNWKCHCASGTCDQRRVACNQFRYGQCHTEIDCYGPVVCRVITCTPPWQFDTACGTTSLTDNSTASHSRPVPTGHLPVGDRPVLVRPRGTRWSVRHVAGRRTERRAGQQVPAAGQRDALHRHRPPGAGSARAGPRPLPVGRRAGRSARLSERSAGRRRRPQLRELAARLHPRFGGGRRAQSVRGLLHGMAGDPRCEQRSRTADLGAGKPAKRGVASAIPTRRHVLVGGDRHPSTLRPGFFEVAGAGRGCIAVGAADPQPEQHHRAPSGHFPAGRHRLFAGDGRASGDRSHPGQVAGGRRVLRSARRAVLGPADDPRRAAEPGVQQGRDLLHTGQRCSCAHRDLLGQVAGDRRHRVPAWDFRSPTE